MKKIAVVVGLGLLIALALTFAAVGQSDQPGAVPDPNYDDSWAQNFPTTIDGFNVGHISTPKDRACSTVPVIHLQTQHGSMAEFLSNPPNIDSLRVALESIDGAPSDVRFSFSPTLIDRQAVALRDQTWNAQKREHGCDVLADIQVDDSSDGTRGFAIFQNKDAGKYTDDDGQGVKIKTPSSIGTGQDSFSAALNNVKTNTGYFMQTGMIFRENDPYIAWSETAVGLVAYEFADVPYKSNTRYQFSISRSSSTWQMCAGNDEDIDDYQCVATSVATGTHLKEDVNTSVFFENANDNDNWHSGFPSTVSVSHAKLYRSGTGQAWGSEDRWTVHACGSDQYPVSGAMNSTLKNNGSATWKMAGIPLACP